jgi:hypothetical protein
VSLSRGGKPALLNLPSGSVAGPETAVDVDDDGFAELIIQSGTGDGVKLYSVARYLQPGLMSLLKAPPVGRLAAGIDGSNAGWGFACVSGGVQFAVGTSSDGGQTYQVTTTTLKPDLDGNWAQQGAPATSTLSATAAAPSFTARCGSL